MVVERFGSLVDGFTKPHSVKELVRVDPRVKAERDESHDSNSASLTRGSPNKVIDARGKAWLLPFLGSPKNNERIHTPFVRYDAENPIQPIMGRRRITNDRTH